MSGCASPPPHNILFVWTFDKYVCVLLRAYLSFCAPVCVWVCVVKCHGLLLCMQVCVDEAGFGACGGWRAMQANRFSDINSCDMSKDIVVMFCFVF